MLSTLAYRATTNGDRGFFVDRAVIERSLNLRLVGEAAYFYQCEFAGKLALYVEEDSSKFYIAFPPEHIGLVSRVSSVKLYSVAGCSMLDCGDMELYIGPRSPDEILCVRYKDAGQIGE